jgi:hypothetical protein
MNWSLLIVDVGLQKLELIFPISCCVALFQVHQVLAVVPHLSKKKDRVTVITLSTLDC